MKLNKSNLLLSVTSLASLLSLPALADPGFYSVAELKDRPQNLERAAAATFLISTGFNGNCSAFFVSDTGYAVTAMHCVAANITNQHQVTYYSRDWESYYSAAFVPPLPNQSYPAYLQPYALGDLVTKPDLSQSNPAGLPQIITHGKSLTAGINFDGLAKLDPSEHAKFFAGLRGAEEDFAILKFEPLPDKKTPCVKLKPNVPAIGTKLWGMGYPSRTTRLGFPSHSATELQISVGKTVSSFDPNPATANLPAPAKVSYLNHFHRERVMLTNLDCYFGNSGGLALNESGEAIGVITSMLDFDPPVMKDIYLENATMALSAERIYETTLKHVGQAKTTEIFSCEDESSAE